MIFQDKSLVYHSLKVLKFTSFQGVSKSVIQTIEKTILLLFIVVHVVRSIAGLLCEATDILTHSHSSLLYIFKFLFLDLDNPLGYMMRPENHLELIPIDVVGFFMGFYICIPPISCSTYELV
jgi:hypothetical protein